MFGSISSSPVPPLSPTSPDPPQTRGSSQNLFPSSPPPCWVTQALAVSERGSETGRVPCVKILAPDWNTIRILGVCAGMGPVLLSPWGISIDRDGNVLVADWADQGHRIVLYPSRGVGQPIITEGLSSPRGLTILPEGHLAVSDSMHHCVKIFRYKNNQD
uniref:NHL repeat containing 4 n=1 Tax=Periophthalmus magnuspinnatus TaxID=409849 RepID=A0A3B4AQQ6_9GOBI